MAELTYETMQKKNKKTIILSLGFLLAACSSLFASADSDANYMRVAIIQDTVSLRLKINGFYEVIDSENNKFLYRSKDLNTTVMAYKEGILLDGVITKTKRIFVKPDNDKDMTLEGRAFRGGLELIKKDNLHLLVVNRVELEGYIKGILYHEVSHFWPYEALRAQAIVCRTYALYQKQENKNKDYDVTNDIYSQVYGGRTSERYRTSKAVDQTKGYVLLYNDRVIPAYFHATCAGHTEDASLLWNIDIMPLKGVTCVFCKGSPHFKWHYVLSLDEMRDALINAGFGVGKIKDIVILGVTNSGRIRDIKIINEKKDLKIPAKDFRNIFGPNIIRSTKFTVRIAGNDAVFEGSGWGHGAGMCQWGAYFMAKKGYHYEDILKFYYPGTKIALIADQ